MYRIRKRFAVEASHHLEGLPEGHKCARQHGHSYRVTVWIEARELDQIGFVLDFGRLDEIKRELDHSDLNSVLAFNPTSERLAEYIHRRVTAMLLDPLSRVERVRVSETESTYAEFDG